MKKLLVVVAGPTAVGKTAIAIELAKHFNSEIVSADSRQFYKELSIGTAKPTPEELAQIPHHFINTLSISENYSVANFEKDATELLESLFKNNNVIFVCGGTGLFIKALLQGLDNIPSVDENIRIDLEKKYIEQGIEALQNELKAVDAESYNTIDNKNKQRVIRALEVYRGTGKPFSSFKTNLKQKRNFESLQLVLELPREELYNRINIRVDAMMNEGLLKEAESVFNYKDANALQTVGYKELFDYFENKLSLTEAIEKIKQHTRNLAKRQLTWFRKDETAHWFLPSQTKDMIALINQKIKTI